MRISDLSGARALFVLGGEDPEMRAIRRALSEAGLPCAKALGADGRWAARSMTNEAAGAELRIPGFGEYPTAREEWEFVGMVECRIPSWGAPDFVADHHAPGDPGWGKGPEAYWAGSSLGQVLSFLGQEGSLEQRLCAAADHCLGAAYAGRCPGVDPDELLWFRAAEKSFFLRVGTGEAARLIEAAARVVSELPGSRAALFDADDPGVPLLAEGAARAGRAILYRGDDGFGGIKSMGKGFDPEACSKWMEALASAGLPGVYGNPSRGYFGVRSRIDFKKFEILVEAGPVEK